MKNINSIDKMKKFYKTDEKKNNIRIKTSVHPKSDKKKSIINSENDDQKIICKIKNIKNTFKKIKVPK